MTNTPKEYDADVIVIGAGPAGLMSAILLGQRGRSVIVVERHAAHYPLPRAVTFDDEAARLLSRIGIDADNDEKIQYFRDWYELKNGNGEVLARYDWRGQTKAGWHRLYWFNQPELEVRLAERIQQIPAIKVARGSELLDLSQDGQSVSIRCREEATGIERVLSAKYLIGADGANSLVRTKTALPVHDLGFQFDWLIVDIKTNEPMVFDPPIFQLCDPTRPTTVVPAGPGRRRWEFMVLPGETPELLNNPDAAWRLLDKWGANPQNCTLERHAVWRFQAKWAETWRSGRILIAGDAAHLMPPFAGQGMCAALRDANNLAWKLDLALAGLADDGVLGTYGDERREHVREFINLSVGIGGVVCITDPAEAAERDRAMMADLAANGPKPSTDPNLSLGNGIWIEGHGCAGKLSSQGYVSFGGNTGRFDEFVDGGWAAIGWKLNPLDHISQLQREVLDRLGVRAFEMTDEYKDGAIFDRDGTYKSWFDEIKSQIILIRPDFYVAISCSAESFSRSLDELGAKMHLKVRSLELSPA
ncbi:bifunctional 3-(3-hydroxy-phenyl)propionate/3-hydroxycinnamic acid hydroxylase [Xanthobacter dioxanivorans]|uniref:Bifunctional 3-(3-hydroxy-phenyl)propionate/3-hydroxycinnamic acid hydroxylase n=2 Tax=Xanthobacter dioxanivorans TaxID=2528964 RepID=A0A974PQX9_9HYPH|nr:bifunctional 3-(3-hydroxy-phenyl)propionate/3-hydroxycinnamic acid hydroxylase [Xanthobacter dioxanivorans]QRG07891.1 bifunctional 3-(3-hydroxy-phenyl)propionate/3-hydroxycinnamic acid hydroxylase [Xanthobacter dioxanivorans]